MRRAFDSVKTFCSVSGKFCDCDPRCLDAGIDDLEQRTYCGCDKGELTASERATGRCGACGKAL